MEHASVQFQVNPTSVPSLPSRSALSRFLAALNEQTVEALRTQFLEDLLERATPFSHPGGVWDRRDQQYVVVDVDGTRQAARQRALPHLPTLPEPHRRLTQVAAPGYTGRKRGEVVRTRTTILQAHTHQWLGTFGGADNGDLRGGLERACKLVISYATKQQLLPSQMLLRLDGAYGDTAVLSDVLEMGVGVIARSRDYALLGRPEVLAVLSRPPVVRWSHPESGMVRDLYDCSSIRLLREGPWVFRSFSEEVNLEISSSVARKPLDSCTEESNVSEPDCKNTQCTQK
ncbi:hypothetical protein KSF_007950 [Reticulibacter mediterranei]|uniref:Uncharacterized protein n=1 Tax=Reticulibacter mediterranei TaxID=2778369 RepID=A0A8J3IFS4_9CHLR|nr:hypothetical protein [Reticulibacter mediterranei]GHO90747.1 hypothetical protein KSF_007950 [Reticulibacter mediterranei]